MLNPAKFWGGRHDVHGGFRALRALPLLASAAIAVSSAAGAASPAAAAVKPAHATAHASSASAEYYLALGDSLAQGVQPAPGTGVSAPTDQGYVDDLLAHYQPQFNGNLTVVKLGCQGETSTSMLTGTGSPCTYPQGSQLAAALAFIRAHQGQIALITIDIGANNVDNCTAGGGISLSCLQAGAVALQTDLPQILSKLRAAAGNGTVIAGMNLYDPFLADWSDGTSGQILAAESVGLDVTLNADLAANFAVFGVKDADVQGAFSTTDFLDTTQVPGAGTVPLNVGRICEWTWMCAASPAGPNIHANATGYSVIASAFEQVIKLPAISARPRQKAARKR
jgi:lysophospholipase L1-like esterase